MRRRVVLASASPRRGQLLLQVGIEPDIRPSSVEEIITGTAPEQVVRELSLQKAEDVAVKYQTQDVIVIGADTVVSENGAILGKPKSREEAVQMISLLQGNTHQVYTGVSMIFCDTGETVSFAERTDVTVYPMSKSQIEAYVETGEPMDKAGAYGIQGLFAAYVKEIRGDYSNVVGLPLGRVCQELRERE